MVVPCVSQSGGSHQVFGVDFTQALQREGRASAIPQHRSRPGRSAPSMRTLASSEKPPPCSQLVIVSVSFGSSTPRRASAQQTPADLGLHFVEQLLVGRTTFAKRRRSRRIRREDTLDDAAVEVLSFNIQCDIY